MSLHELKILAATTLLVLVPALPATAQPCTDATPPDLEITSPARAEMLVQGGVADDGVVATGQADDTESLLVSLVVDGVEQLTGPTAGPVPFAVPTTSVWGANVLVASAEDACGNRAELVQGYLRGGDYFPAATEPAAAAAVGSGMVVHLYQPLLDDGDDDPDDLRTFVDGELGDIDWNAVFPSGRDLASDPCRSSNDCTFGAFWADTCYLVETNGAVTADALRLDSLTAAAGGLDFAGGLDEFFVPLRGFAETRECVAGLFLDDRITVSGSVRIQDASATGTIDGAPSGGEVAVAIPSLDVDLGSISVTISCGIFQFLCNPLVNGVVFLFQGAIESALEDGVIAQIPEAVESFFDDFEIQPHPALPPPFSRTLEVVVATDAFDAGSGGIDLGLATQVHPPARGSGIAETAPGSIRRDDGSAPFPSGAYELGFLLKDDLLNQWLWALWYGGGLDLADLRGTASALGFPVVSLSLVAALPPVAASGSAPDRIEVVLADAFFEGTFDLAELLGPPAAGSVAIQLYASTRLGGVPGFSPATQGPRFDVDDVAVDVQVVASDDPAAVEALGAVLPELVGEVVAELVARAIAAIRHPLLPPGSLPAGMAFGMEAGAAERPTEASTGTFGAAGPLADLDADGAYDVPGSGDNCLDVPNPHQQDRDADGFGDACDCDFTGDGFCSLDDFVAFLPDFVAGVDSGAGTDMTSDGSVGLDDFVGFLPGFQAGGPGPSASFPPD